MKFSHMQKRAAGTFMLLAIVESVISGCGATNPAHPVQTAQTTQTVPAQTAPPTQTIQPTQTTQPTQSTPPPAQTTQNPPVQSPPASVKPTIEQQPANVRVVAGQTATFKISAAAGSPIEYQWRKNGVPISAATSASYTTPATAAADDGSVFSVAVSNAAGSVTSAAATLSVTAAAAAVTLHYAANATYDSNGTYLPGAIGYNLADVSDVATLNSLPAGVMGLVWLGLCNGADANFQAIVQPFIGNSKLYGFYLMDEPDPTGQYAPACPAAKLKAESDWIHAHAPGTKTFIVLMNFGSDTAPTYANTYNPANSGVDLFGLDPYPVRPQYTGGVNYAVIGASITAAEAQGIPRTSIVPVYQAFGGGGYSTWTLPTVAQAQQLLATWDALISSPPFDYTYSWGSQKGDQALSTAKNLQPVFLQHNTTH